ncbi:MAG: MbcA/ParS/Xre antitoxin family protein [Pseudomonadota bacterium]
MADATTTSERTIFQMASEAFGSDFAEDWLNRPSRIFDGLSPKEMASQESGAQAVLDFIGALLHGSKTDGELAFSA